MIVASFSHMTRLGDTFIRQLKEKGEDFTNLWAFSEFLESIDKNRVPNEELIPVGLRKCKELGIKNVIIEFDLVYRGIDYNKFTVEKICQLCSERMKWARENLSPDARVLFNLRDFSDAMVKVPARQFKVINYLSSLPATERPFGLIYEESGKYLPEELGAWTRAVRDEMDDCGFKEGHLLVHVHEQWGAVVTTQLECIANGANGIWASLCEEGASMGHCSSTMTLMNMIRLGNERVLKQYNCTKLREAAINVQVITTGKPPHPKQPVYGERALDMVFGMPNFAPNKKDFNMAEFFGEKPVMRITTLASKAMIATRLKNVFGDDPQFTEERGQLMREQMLEDLKWAVRQYPDIKDSEELLSVAFRKGLIPAMQEEVLQQT